MMITIDNGIVSAAFSSFGAQMKSLKDKASDTELIWQGSVESWKDSAPVLFPIIGRLKNSSYRHDGREFQMPKHGFARNSEFTVTEKSKTSVTFTLTDSAAVADIYPFKFNFSVKYELTGSCLSTVFTVINTDNKDIYFAAGGHPGFNIPYSDTETETGIDGNTLVFEKPENPVQYTFEQNELLIDGVRGYGQIKEMPLSKKLFAEDAILLGKLESNYVTLKKRGGGDIRFRFYDVPYLAFWTHAKRGGYICIEPWCGLPDYFNPASELKEKEGINRLNPGGVFTYKFDIEINPV